MKKILLLFLFFGFYNISNADVIPQLALTHGTGSSNIGTTILNITNKNDLIHIYIGRSGGIYASGFTNFGVDFNILGDTKILNYSNANLYTYAGWVTKRISGSISLFEFNPLSGLNHFSIFPDNTLLTSLSGVGGQTIDLSFKNTACGTGSFSYAGRFTSDNFGKSVYSIPLVVNYTFDPCNDTDFKEANLTDIYNLLMYIYKIIFVVGFIFLTWIFYTFYNDILGKK